MSDIHLAMFFSSGWLASMLVGVSIDIWRMRRQQCRAVAVEPAEPCIADRPARSPAAALPLSKTNADIAFDGVKHTLVG